MTQIELTARTLAIVYLTKYFLQIISATSIFVGGIYIVFMETFFLVLLSSP